jgi:two-component system, NarL family, response regulator DegU
MAALVGGARPRVLIVDDNPRVRALVRDVIRSSVGSISECGDGCSAEKLYAAEQPDWVLMDITMPGCSGITATRRIVAAYPEAKIVMLTDHDDEAFRLAAAEAGAIAFVLKEEMQELPNVIGS